MSRACDPPKGAARKFKSFRASTKLPPRPDMTIGLKTGSRCTPRMVSTPPVTMGATRQPSIAASGWAERAVARISSKAVSASVRLSATPRRTPPMSLLVENVRRDHLEDDGKAELRRRVRCLAGDSGVARGCQESPNNPHLGSPKIPHPRQRSSTKEEWT